MTAAVHLLLGHPEVELFLDAHELRDATVDLETMMLSKADDGTPLVLFAIRLDDGSRVMASVTFKVMQTAMAGMLSALNRRSGEAPSSTCNERPLRAIYPCGCSHHKVELGMCSVYGPDGKLRT